MTGPHEDSIHPFVPRATAAPDARPDEVSGDAVLVLVIATVLFTFFFAVWVMFSIVGLKMKAEFGLSEGEFALLAAVPILTGSLLRVPVGIFTDQIGGRNMMMGLLIVTAIPTWMLTEVESYNGALLLALGIGLAGTSFAVGIAWVSAWYPASHQGVALGVFGAGNVGASITKLIAPGLIAAVGTGGLLGGLIPGGWRVVPALFAIMLVVCAIVLPFIAPKPDRKPSKGRGFAEMSRPLLIVRVWRFGFYYVTVFGAYVALALWLPHYYQDVYGIGLAKAGLLTALFIFPASLLRPYGGYLSDKIGARQVTAISFGVIAATAFVLSIKMSLVPFIVIVFVMGVAMGIGKASVYTYIPQYFPRDVGAVGGLVGAVGGLGGFVLPLLFAWAKESTGRAESTFYVMTGLAVLSMLFLSIAVSRIKAGAHHAEM